MLLRLFTVSTLRNKNKSGKIELIRMKRFILVFILFLFCFSFKEELGGSLPFLIVSCTVLWWKTLLFSLPFYHFSSLNVFEVSRLIATHIVILRHLIYVKLLKNLCLQTGKQSAWLSNWLGCSCSQVLSLHLRLALG